MTAPSGLWPVTTICSVVDVVLPDTLDGVVPAVLVLCAQAEPQERAALKPQYVSFLRFNRERVAAGVPEWWLVMLWPADLPELQVYELRLCLEQRGIVKSFPDAQTIVGYFWGNCFFLSRNKILRNNQRVFRLSQRFAWFHYQ